MNLTIEAIRWLNYRFPWHQLKPSLAKRLRPRLDLTPGRRIFDRIQGNLRMQLDLSLDFERDIYLNTSNMAMATTFRKLLRPGDVVVDGGANIGFLSLLAWQCVGPSGKVYAFEPQPGALELLADNIRLNQADNIIVVSKALWHETGTSKLYEFDEADHDLPSLGKRSDKQISREIIVETVRMDDVIHQPVRLYKLDIEGAEWSAMRGSQQILFGDPPPHVIIELNPQTCEPFGHAAIEVVDWMLEHARHKRMHLIRRRNCRRINRDELARLFENKPNKSHNVWFEPI